MLVEYFAASSQSSALVLDFTPAAVPLLPMAYIKSARDKSHSSKAKYIKSPRTSFKKYLTTLRKDVSVK
jgi:hypothetical protein